MKALAIALCIASSLAFASDCRSDSEVVSDADWCRDLDGGYRDGNAVVWWTETSVESWRVADSPYAPAYAVRLRNVLCEACENRSDRLVYISRKIDGDDLDEAPDRSFLLDRDLVWELMDAVKAAKFKNRRVRVFVRTDLPGKRSIRGKHRDPIVAITVL